MIASGNAAATEAHFRAHHGVSLRALVPVAAPASLSRQIIINLEPGERCGWCYRWDHDAAWELDRPARSFAEALAELTDAIARRDRETLEFLGISLE